MQLSAWQKLPCHMIRADMTTILFQGFLTWSQHPTPECTSKEEDYLIKTWQLGGN